MAVPNDISRFRNTELILVDDQEVFGTWSQPQFLLERPDESLINKFRVTSALEGRPDLIAARLYGTPQLDWVLVAFNNVRDVLNWPRAGDTIEYPLETVVFPQL